MTIHINELIEFVAELCDDKNIKACGKESLKGGVVTGACAFLGGLLLGPVGLAIGGTLGGITSAMTSKNLVPVGNILRQMPSTQKVKLANHLMSAFRDFGIEDLTALGTLIVSNVSLEALLIKELSNYLNNEMKMRIRS